MKQVNKEAKRRGNGMMAVHLDAYSINGRHPSSDSPIYRPSQIAYGQVAIAATLTWDT